MSDDVCPLCGGYKILFNGEPCSCVINKKTFNKGITLLDVPEQYQGIEYNESVVDKTMGDFYSKTLSNIYKSVCSSTLKNRNYLICSPKQTSKTVMAYSALQFLFQNDIDVFPIYDVLELRKMTIDMDLNRKQTYTVSDPEKILNVQYLFVKIPAYIVNEVFQMMSVLVDRRSRRNACTIFIYDGSYKTLEKLDYKSILKSLVGDGSYGTIKVHNFWREGEQDE